MSERQETIADIIARKRRLVAEMEKTLGDQHSSVEMLKDDADRLEAAHKRERETSGNTAALHEALKPVKRYLDGYTVNILELRRTVDAALTAPTRNCDRFASAVEAMAELKRVHSYCAKENRRCLEDCPDCGKEWCSLAWLFALATESEAQA